MKFLSVYKLIGLVILSLFLLYNSTTFAETTKNYKVELAQAPSKYVVGKVVLIPFNSTQRLASEQAEESIADIERYLTLSLYETLVSEASNMPDIDIVPLQKSETEFNKLKSGKPKIYYKDIAIDTGRILDADSVMVGTISDYTERGGSEWGVENPTTVTFRVELLSTIDGRVMWESYFTETQKPLFDNLFEIKKFVKRKGKWITADEMAKEGARETARQFGRFVLEQR